MKFFYSILIAICFLALNTKAQVIQSFGIKIGYVSASQEHTLQTVNNITKGKSGFTAGVFVDLFNFTQFSVSPEIKYIQKGVALDLVKTGVDGEIVDNYTGTINHDIISIPILFTYKNEFELGALFLKLGPRYDILLNSSDDMNNDASLYDDFKNVFGATFTVGFIPQLNLGIKPFIDFSYHYDFTEIYSGSNNQITNSAFDICIGVLF